MVDKHWLITIRSDTGKCGIRGELSGYDMDFKLVLKPIWNWIVLWMAPLESFQYASLSEMREAVRSSVVVFRLSILEIQKSIDRTTAGYDKVPYIA